MDVKALISKKFPELLILRRGNILNTRTSRWRKESEERNDVCTNGKRGRKQIIDIYLQRLQALLLAQAN